MNRFFLLILFIGGLFSPGSAQISLQSTYHSGLNQEAAWPVSNQLNASVHYWTRLKRYRLEFLPGILFQNLSNEERTDYQNLGITVPVSIYPLDFVNDCDCPTFSKNSFWFQKGFFIRLTPSWSANINAESPEAYDQLFGIGISLGVDFGWSDLLTITPQIGYDQIHSISEASGRGGYLHAGIAFLFRHDYRNRYR
ncbi:hypothetical protein KUV50_16935 [Membranicola marinus]|uniref:Outer membrane protein beta-barrel domain-containing protein n=1 Tax=Membranihabitans marinus TaxID=1227546 RepID=A0A953HQD5_9BACT|nr:hypothetical protein [Membranihabitans marinus]MBY5959842.1 hypothetical protein [Membranihabitans marinus]